MSHKAGLAANPSMSDMSTIRLSEKSLPEQRRAAVTAILAMKPTSEPDTAFLYSNAGFITAGAIVESIGGDSWEALLRREVLEPLGLESAGFGAPGEAGENDQPRGHTYGESTGRHFPAEPPLADNPAFLGPAGTLHLSLSDLVTWGQVHMRGERGEIAVPSVPEWLSTQTFRTLHRERGDRYALGWVDEAADPDRQGLSRTIWHNGSNTFWYALLLFQPELDRGVVMITNAGIHAAALVDREARRLLEEHAPSGSGEGR